MADSPSSGASSDIPASQKDIFSSSQPFPSGSQEETHDDSQAHLPSSQEERYDVPSTSSSTTRRREKPRGPNFPRPLDEITKVFQDPIHGTIELKEVYMKIIDTPEFQRLRNIKHLGTVNLVYAGAVHTRFEHSIGTCYLALRLIGHLKETQKELGITAEEELCVGLAALCHDLGHGPFSHMFETFFIPKFKPDGYERWTNRLAAIKIFDEMIETYDLKQTFSDYGYKMMDFHFHLIKEMIYGPLKMNGNGDYPEADDYQATYRNRYFLYEIVSNRINQIDVDKWDCFSRDSYHLGVTSNFIHNRFIKFAKVLQVKTKKGWQAQICYRDKEAPSAYEMFHTRYRLYRMARYHPVTVALDLMVTDVLIEAAEHLELRKPNGKPLNMKKILNDMDAYGVLDDNILNTILHSYGNERLGAAREILQRMQRREIYKLVARFQLKKGEVINDEDIKLEEIVKDKEGLDANDLCSKVVVLDYGLKEKNPVDQVLFYSKGDQTPRKIAKDQVSYLLPHTFEERQLLMYVKDYAKKDLASECIHAWARNQRWIMESQNVGLLRTPYQDRTSSKPTQKRKLTAEDSKDGDDAKKKLHFT